MLKLNRYYAKVENFKSLLTLSVEEGPNIVPEWLRRNIFNKEEKTDTSTIKAFFQAEQELIQSYLKTNKMDKLSLLIQQFTSTNNTDITKWELELLREVLTKESEFLDSHTEEKQELAKVLSTFKEFATENADSETQKIWSEITRSCVGDFIEET